MKKRMYGWKKMAAAALAAVMTVSGLPYLPADAAADMQTDQEQEFLGLWYDSAAEDSYNGWHDWSLPLGNSAIGAGVFGGVSRDRIQLNEKSLWSGGPSESRPDYNGGNVEANGRNGQTMKEIQQAFASGDTQLANALCDQLTGVSDDGGTQGYGYYLSYGSMYMEFPGMTDSEAQNYRRELDLRTAVSCVEYDYQGVHYEREYFVSYPDNVLVTRLTADEEGALDVNVQVEPDNESGGSNQGYQRTWDTEVEDGRITVAGQLSDNQMRFNSQTLVLNDGGTREDRQEEGKVCVSDADSVLILTSIGTDYKNVYPEYRTGETDAQVDQRVGAYVDAAAQKSYEELRADHVADHAEIFSRVELDLGQEASDKTTDALLQAYNNGTATDAERRYLEVLLFQYGRYLTIASSRDNSGDESRTTLPSNLQGIWAGGNSSPWHSDYHLNVNLQMNYWPVYSTNMAECAQPLIDYVDSLRGPGRVTAKIYAGIESTEENPENGFMAHTQNNPFGWTCPGWSFDWGWSPAAVPWILQNCWEYYEYTQDLEYMKENIYPMLKEEAVLYSQMLIEDPDGGGLVCSPAFSPEHGPRTNGNTYEQTLIWQLFEDVITAGELTGEDQQTLQEWREIQDNLKGPIEVGKDGQIKEWYIEEEYNKDAQGNTLGEGYSHRHMSHLLGLYPGDLISVETPELLEAAVVSLENRVDKTTGWGMGQRINSWARVGDGDHAYKLIEDLFENGILPNLWDTHAPFQIDGNFGMTAGVAEMLLQSNVGYINILPALPAAWADGEVDGLVARGNFEIGMKWENESPVWISVHSRSGGEAKVQSDGIATATVLDEQGNPVAYEALSEDRISFQTEQGKTYTIVNIPSREILEAPQDLIAMRAEADSVALQWTPAEGQQVTYTLYRQADEGDVQKIAEGIAETSYVDETAREALGTLRYWIQAVAVENGEAVESDRSAPCTVFDIRNMAGMADDRDERILYSDGWSTYEEDGLYEGTSTFIEQPSGNETARFFFNGTGIEVYATVNYDRGIAEVWIDGTYIGEADSYASSKANYTKIFETTGLSDGMHVLELKVVNRHSASSTNSKFELDGFKVHNEKATIHGITVSSASGIDTLTKENSSLQMEASVDTVAGNKDVVWSVADESGKETDLAQIDENGRLTIRDTSGTVRVRATSVQDKNVSGEKEITIAIPGKTGTEKEKIEFAVNNEANTEDFVWSGSWGTYNQDDLGDNGKNHDNLDKIESNQVGAAVSGTFEGTGLEIYGHKHPNFGKFELTIDNGEPIEVDTYYEADYKDELLCQVKDLENQEHTFTITVKEAKNVALDYCIVSRPEGETVQEKTELQTLIEQQEGRYEEQYISQTWTPYQEAYQKAVEVMNDPSADGQSVLEAISSLREAAENLQEKAELPKPDVTGKQVRVVSKESSAILLEWDDVESATSYKVSVNGEEAGRTENYTFKATGLQPDTEYVFEVEAVNRIGQAASFELVTASTNAKPVEPGQIRNLVREGNLLTWEAPENLADASYEIWVNGALRTKTEETAWTLEAEGGKTYTVSIFAVNESGEKSLPVSLTFLLEEVPEAVTIESVEALDPIEAEYGTAFENLPLPENVWVILSSGERVSMEVTWDQTGYQVDHPGTQRLMGELRATDGIENVKGVKAEIAVTAKEPSQQPDTGEEKPDTPEPGDNGQQPTNPDGETPGQTNPGQNAEQAPEPVKNLKQKAQGTTWITLTWKKSADADGYLIYSRKAGEKREKLAATVAAGNANTCKVRKLKQAQTYTFRVVPYKDVNGKRLLGTARSKKVSTATKVPKIKGKILASGGVSISWKKVKKCSGYEIVMSGKKKKGYKKVGTLRKASAVKFNKKKGLKKGKTYYFKVRTYRKAGKTKIYSAYSKAIRIRM